MIVASQDKTKMTESLEFEIREVKTCKKYSDTKETE